MSNIFFWDINENSPVFFYTWTDVWNHWKKDWKKVLRENCTTFSITMIKSFLPLQLDFFKGRRRFNITPYNVDCRGIIPII